MKVALNGPRIPIVDENKLPTDEFQQFLEFLWKRTGGNDDYVDSNFNGVHAAIAELSARIEDVARQPSDTRASEIQQLRDAIEDIRRLVNDVSVTQSELLFTLMVSGFMLPFLTSQDAASARGYLGIASLATQSASNVAITGGTIENTPIGAVTPASIKGTTINATGTYQSNGTNVIGARQTGWTQMTGVLDKATAYATGTITHAQLAERVAALEDVFHQHGLTD